MRWTSVLELLPWPDWLAMGVFILAWLAYSRYAHQRGRSHATLLATTNALRQQWMHQVTRRENRIVDGAVTQQLSSSPSFFASTTILILGGLFALIGTSEKASDLVKDLPFAAATSIRVFDFKLLVLSAVFVFAFFRFTWSMRQYTFGCLMIGAAPDAAHFQSVGEAAREAYARRAGAVMGMAAETFNDGLRAYYLSFAVIAWFFSPWAFMIATVGVIWVLYQREFHSDILAVLRQDA